MRAEGGGQQNRQNSFRSRHADSRDWTHVAISLRSHPLEFGPSLRGFGKIPARIQRHIVVRLFPPVISRTSGRRMNTSNPDSSLLRGLFDPEKSTGSKSPTAGQYLILWFTDFMTSPHAFLCAPAGAIALLAIQTTGGVLGNAYLPPNDSFERRR